MTRQRRYAARNPIRNSTILPNEIFMLGLKPTAIAIYAYLLRVENRETYTCYPSYGAIAKSVGCSARTVGGYICELCEKRLIEVEHTKTTTKKDGLRWNGTLKYKILPIQGALKYHNEHELKKLEAGLEKKRVAMKRAEQHRQQRERERALASARAKHIDAIVAERESEALPF